MMVTGAVVLSRRCVLIIFYPHPSWFCGYINLLALPRAMYFIFLLSLAVSTVLQQSTIVVGLWVMKLSSIALSSL
ncbi:MAG: hypothetical protein HY529_03025 [Chloroflexi bacterium]|nr:hypothetical protein [Chloroflexota bacterium]